MVYVDVTNRPTTKGVNYEDRSFLVPELGKNNVKSGATYFKIIVVIVPTYIYIPVRPGIHKIRVVIVPTYIYTGTTWNTISDQQGKKDKSIQAFPGVCVQCGKSRVMMDLSRQPEINTIPVCMYVLLGCVVILCPLYLL